MSHIDTVLLDVGGVLISEYDQTGNDVQQRVGLDDETFGRLWPDIVQQYGSGKMSEESVWDILAKHGGRHVEVSEDVIGRPFIANLIIYHDVIDAVQKIADHGICIGILSNTVTPHARVLREKGIYKSFGDHVYLSHEIGIRKPDISAYQLAIDRMGVTVTQNVLYVDDRLPNLRPAETLGMHTLLAVDHEQTATKLLSLINS